MSWWDDMWAQINRPVNFAPQKVDIHSKAANPYSDPDQMGNLYKSSQYNGPQASPARTADVKPVAPYSGPNPSNNVTSNTALTNADPTVMPGGGNSMMDQLRAAIDGLSSSSNSPYMANLDAARSASLKNIADARGQVQGNFDQSNAAIGGLYAKGKIDTLADGDILKSSNANLVGGLNGMYGGAIEGLQNDRSKELGEKTEMLQRLGIGAAGLGSAGDTQTKAIADATQNQTAAGSKALEYGASDLTANTARASGMVSEGAGRQAALRSQLAGILGQLSNKELDVNNQYATNSMNASNQDYQDKLSRIQALYGMYDKEQTRGDNMQKTLLNSKVIAQAMKGGSGGSGAMTNIDDANSYASSQGQNPGDYNSAYSDAVMNAPGVPGSPQTEQQLLQYMHSKRPDLDVNQLIAYVRNASNSSKYNTPTSGGLPQNILSMLG